MIAFVKGRIDDISEENVVLDVGGIGYKFLPELPQAYRGLEKR